MIPGILFVDDEPSVLNALRRSLRLLRGSWEVHFAPDGEAALEMLAKMPIDVVVTDMRMPGMDGVQLLAAVHEQHPSAVRMVMSGHSGTEAIAQSVALAHQYLAKPTDVDSLTAILGQVLKARERVTDNAVRVALGQVTSLPVPGPILVELQGDADSLARHAVADPMVAARVLQLANNAFFGLKRETVNPEEAAQALRSEHVEALVTVSNVFTTRGGDTGHALRERAVNAARIARKAAADLGGDERVVALAASAALLHVVGPMLAVAPGNAGASVTTENSAYLMGIWGLPQGLVDLVACCVRPSSAGAVSIALTAVHAACVVVGSAAPDEKYAGWAEIEARLAGWRA